MCILFCDSYRITVRRIILRIQFQMFSHSISRLKETEQMTQALSHVTTPPTYITTPKRIITSRMEFQLPTTPEWVTKACKYLQPQKKKKKKEKGSTANLFSPVSYGTFCSWTAFTAQTFLDISLLRKIRKRNLECSSSTRMPRSLPFIRTRSLALSRDTSYVYFRIKAPLYGKLLQYMAVYFKIGQGV